MQKISQSLNLGLCPKWLSTTSLRIAFSPRPAGYLSAFIAGQTLTLIAPSLPDPVALMIVCAISVVIGCRIKLFRLVATLAIGFSYASWHFDSHMAQPFPADLERQSIRVQGEVVGLPDSNPQRVRFRFKIEHLLQTPDGDLTATGIAGQLVQLSCYRCDDEFQAGQRWILTVRLKQPHAYASWGSFDYEKYLFRHRIVATGYVRLTEHKRLVAQSSPGILALRGAIDSALRELLPQRSIGRGMLAALMIGDRSSLSIADKKILQRTGLSHLVAISGLHVGLVFAVVMFVMRWLLWPFAVIYQWQPRQYLVLFPALTTALGYAGLAGFAVSTQRALIMLSVFTICRLLARETKLKRVLLISAVVILVLDPFSILDFGFWLSCGAVLIIAICSDGAAKVSLPRLQIALWLGMLPMCALFFGRVSLISPLTNLLMVPVFCLLLIPITLLAMLMMLCGVDGLAAVLVVNLADVFELIFNGLSLLSSNPALQWYPLQFDAMDYSLIFLIALAYLGRLPVNGVMKLGLWSLLLISFLVAPRELTEGDINITLLDVGQGLSMVLETKTATLVYDTGPAYQSGFSAANAVLIPFLHTRGVRRIDTLIISHADNDHFGGYPDLKAEFEINDILSSRTDKFPSARNCQAGQRWRLDSSEFAIIAPDLTTPRGGNNRSCILQVVSHGVTTLISADVEMPVERYLVEQGADLRANIMLVPHHGSNSSSTGAFLDAIKPELALLAAGYLNRYGHPHGAVMARYHSRGIGVVSTVKHGSIILKIRRDGWQLVSFRQAERRFWMHQKKPTINR